MTVCEIGHYTECQSPVLSYIRRRLQINHFCTHCMHRF